MDKIIGDMNVLSFFTVYFSIHLINHNICSLHNQKILKHAF